MYREMVFQDSTTDAYGHAKLGGIGDLISAQIKDLSKKYNNGKSIDVINQKLGYLVRGGDQDAIDSIVPMAYGNLALDLIQQGIHGRVMVLKNGRYDNLPIEVVNASKKLLHLERSYNCQSLRPRCESFEMKPLFLVTGD